MKVQRNTIHINGIVQGVGFRPFIYNLANAHKLAGYVINTASGVEIQVEGDPDQIKSFSAAVRSDAPPLAVILDLTTMEIPTVGDQEFAIHHSEKSEKITTFISPDIATCPECEADIRDPENRRYGYAFTNCTNCGPRYTIIEDIPYDRPKTSMRNFPMCPSCEKEYIDPKNRRFHAQPNACPICGPHLELWTDRSHQFFEKDVVAKTSLLIEAGNIIAVKGLGGFHLAVDATNDKAVKKLRRRKQREEKPLAIMVKDLETAGHYVHMSSQESLLLGSPRRPIVLLRKKANSILAESVAPGNDYLGVMLPYTPLHQLLFNKSDKVLVMTSANLSEEPICKDNDEVFDRLYGIADAFLIHNRDIIIRNDDSVTRVLEGQPRILRRSRGYAPQPVLVNTMGPTVLATGGMLKNTVCVLKDNSAILSQHIGDLENIEAFTVFQKTIDHLKRLFDCEPELIIHDLHPDYLSTQWAEEQPLPTLGVQHHWAHLASCMAENQRSGKTIGITMDGTGFGTDGTIWGGEILVGDYSGYERVAHFESVPLPGGDAAIKAPWRTAVSYAYSAFGSDLPSLPVFAVNDPSLIIEMIQSNTNCPLTSSCGRLFDAVAALAGGKQTIRYEGQAAIEFMQLANDSSKPFDYQLDDTDDKIIWPISPIIRSVISAISNGIPNPEISGRFHSTLSKIFVESVVQISSRTGIKTVALTGGVFQNQIIFSQVMRRLIAKGYEVLTHQQVPTNDGGLALGQAIIGRASLQNR